LTVAVPGELSRRKRETHKRLRKTGISLRALGLGDDRHPWVTIFATGSVGRHEVGDHSDLDIFIVDAARDADGEERPLGRIERYELVADVIRAGRGAQFPPFSRDGEFLQVHRLDDLIGFLGKPDEDHLNVFTARMLLVLESHCLVGRAAYDRCVDAVLERYWAEDAETHDFRPTILINDIVRYWKTLCLSYEGWRRELRRPLEADEKIDLLKLKFNRLWLCFAGLSYLLLGDEDMSFPREHARRLVELTPMERMTQIGDAAFQRPVERARQDAAVLDAQVGQLRELLATVLGHYDWWLSHTAPAKAEQERWIAEPGAYRDASARARQFGDDMWRLVVLLGDRVNLTRYLLV
jgi:hypothetical protein